VSERLVEGRRIITSGTLNCPAFALCDKLPGERYVAYVRRHCRDHGLGDFEKREDAERNLGVWCFYFFHKFVFGNKTLTPQPFWEIHAFISWDEWNEDDLEERVPIEKRTYARLPDACDRRIGDVRKMKQVEIPRQCEKTSTGSNAYSIFRSLHEYYVGGVRNFPIMIRSETVQNARDSLGKIKAKSKAGVNIVRLYGVHLVKCSKCGAHSHVTVDSEKRCPGCGETRRIRVQLIGLIDPTRGVGGTGRDSITFRWATNTAEVGRVVEAAELTLASLTGDEIGGVFADDDDFEPVEEDETAIYSVRCAGLKTRLMGQRPRMYVLDDIQSEDNSKTHEMRMQIIYRFDEAKRQVEFGGTVMVYNTRKYVNDFAGGIGVEPMRSLFHTLHRAVYWPTDEPDDPPYVVAGMRYYYPVKGTGEPALDAAEVENLWKQQGERKFATEYLNNPHADKGAVFKRADFHIIDVNDPAQYERIPIEIRYGLGRELTLAESEELEKNKLRIRAFNFWDPAGVEGHSERGDDDFGVGVRVGRYGALFVTCLAAGQWSSSEVWNNVDRLHAYNRPVWSDYEMGVDEKNCRPALLKWYRDQEERSGVAPFLSPHNVHFSKMPKSTKTPRIEKMEQWTSQTSKNEHRRGYEVGFFILSNAGLGDPNIIEKYIGQWLAIGRNADHDDGPDATSRGIKYYGAPQYRAPESDAEAVPPATLTGGMPWGTLKGMIAKPTPKTWGETP
jgi:hypothetical protein